MGARGESGVSVIDGNFRTQKRGEKA